LILIDAALIAGLRTLTAGAKDLWRHADIHVRAKPLLGLTARSKKPKYNNHHKTVHRRLFLLFPDNDYNGKNPPKL